MPVEKVRPTFDRQWTALSPNLFCAGAVEAIQFDKDVFGAEEMARIPDEDGTLMQSSVPSKRARY